MSRPQFGLPIRLVTAGMAFTALVVAGLGWNIYGSFRSTSEAKERAVRVEHLCGVILHLDEVLTMFARMAAATGEGRWEERYHEFEPELDAAIREARALAPDSTGRAAADQTGAANVARVEMELRSFELVRGKRLAEARALLVSPEYEYQKVRYAEGMTRFERELQRAKRAAGTSFRTASQLRLAIVGGVIFLLVVVWLFVLRTMTRWRSSLLQSDSEADRAMAARRESEARYRHLADTARDVIWATDSELRFTYVSPAIRELLGYEPEELVGEPLDLLLSPSAVETAGPEIAAALAGELSASRLEVQLLSKNGECVWCEVDAVALSDEGRFVALQGITRDVSERKEAESERDRLEAQVRHAQKLESLGVLAGGIAHDFNNLLVGILGGADLALAEMTPDGAGRRKVEQIRQAAERAKDLTHQMLTYSGRGRFLVEPVDLDALVEEMTHLLDASISKKAEVHYEFESDLPPVNADATQLRQIVMNLITNASEALGDQPGRISIRGYTADVEEGAFRGMTVGDDPPSGRYVILEVADTGQGMDEATRVRIFDPFYTTKFQGRGLGLAAVLGIVHGHGGALTVESEPGRGTTFRVLLPAGDAAPPPQRSVSAEGGDWRATGTILVADDEPAVRGVVQRMLDRMGFKVLAAADGREAVDVFAEHQDEIVAVILDMTMPRMDGQEALREILRRRPGTPVLLTSGYDETTGAESLDSRVAAFLHKPFALSSLRATLREALEK